MSSPALTARDSASRARSYEPEHLRDYKRAKALGQLALGEQFAYVFDFGDQWEHLCTVGPIRIDPLQTLGIESTGRCHTLAGTATTVWWPRRSASARAPLGEGQAEEDE